MAVHLSRNVVDRKWQDILWVAFCRVCTLRYSAAHEAEVGHAVTRRGLTIGKAGVKKELVIPPNSQGDRDMDGGPFATGTGPKE